MSFLDDTDRKRKYVRNIVVSEIMHEVGAREKSKGIHFYNKGIFDKGIQWYEEGMDLADAPSELRENTNFIRGYELAARQDKINSALEIQGSEWFYSGHSLDEARELYSKNEYFIKGYNEAKNIKKRGWI